jgi:hypothetical protein
MTHHIGYDSRAMERKNYRLEPVRPESTAVAHVRRKMQSKAPVAPPQMRHEHHVMMWTLTILVALILGFIV